MSGFLVVLLYLVAAAAALHAAQREVPRAAFHESALYLAAAALTLTLPAVARSRPETSVVG